MKKTKVNFRFWNNIKSEKNQGQLSKKLEKKNLTKKNFDKKKF